MQEVAQSLVVDGYVLTMLAERAFGAKEFFETRQGVVRLILSLPQALAKMSPRSASLAAPVVEQVVQHLAQGEGTPAQPLRVPTLPTQANRSAGRVTADAHPRGRTAHADHAGQLAQRFRWHGAVPDPVAGEVGEGRSAVGG
jgi:hypothetical protein